MDAYAAAREGAGLFALPDRALIAVTGPLRQKFLHNILSNDVQSRTAGQGSRAAVMDVKGHLVAFLRVLVDKDEILLEVAGGRVDAVERLLVHYRVAAPVRFRRPEAEVVAVVGPPRGRRPPRRRCGVAGPRGGIARDGGRRGRAGARGARGGPSGGRIRPARSAGRPRGRPLLADRRRRRSRRRRGRRRAAHRRRPALVRPRRERGEPPPRDDPGRRNTTRRPRGATSARR